MGGGGGGVGLCGPNYFYDMINNTDKGNRQINNYTVENT